MVGGHAPGEPLDALGLAEGRVHVAGGGHRRGEADICGDVEEDLLDLGAGEAVVEAHLGVQLELLVARLGREDGEHQQRAVAPRELGRAHRSPTASKAKVPSAPQRRSIEANTRAGSTPGTKRPNTSQARAWRSS